MTVRSCTLDGKPGFQHRPPQGPAGPCHTYLDGDPTSKRMALHAAVADANHALETETATP